ncbi:MAG: penicillin-binding transpeptidase domain-containing protein [Methylacidiphilales bacterium]|nr:penicillin-binding transpeptidase domain-containing protein [Candidatus Methylacidiphilales bacterium]
MSDKMRVRAMMAIVLFALAFTVISGRLVYLQLVCHEKYRDEAIRKQYAVRPIAPVRGRILDCQNRVLAQSTPVTDLRIDGKLALENPEGLEPVAHILSMAPEELRGLVAPEKRDLLIRQELDSATLEQLKELKYKPLIFSDRIKRIYPNGAEASHVVGFTNQVEKTLDEYQTSIQTEQGVFGIEQVFDKYLTGIPGERRIVLNASRKEIAAYRQYDRQPRNGLDVVLTLDQVVQHVIEEEADRLCREYSPKTVSIIVMRPSTGEILGITNRPTFDPNDRKTMEPISNLRDCAITDIYEPGSTFKIVTSAAVLSEGIVGLDTPIFCENGSFFYAGQELKDTSPHGTLPFREALKVSSNIAFAKLGLALGEERLYRQIRLMGFGDCAQNPRLALPGEQKGILRPTNYWTKLSLTRVPIGYEVGVTNLQMTMAMASIANGGKLMEPVLVKSVMDPSGRVVKEYLPRVVRQVVTPEVAAQVRQALEGVVEDGGTGSAARLDKFTVSGKTGTAWKLVNGSYSGGAYYSSFLGFVPSENPQFLVSILVDEPQGKVYYGGKVAGPAFKNIATQVAQQLNMVPKDPVTMLAKGPKP